MDAIVISGPPGSGKSKTLEALSDLLYDKDVHHAVLETEAVSWSHPGLPNVAVLRHLNAVASLFDEEGYDLILVASPVESAGELRALIEALGATGCFLAQLDADEDVLCERVAAREPVGWSQLDRLLGRVKTLRQEMLALDIADLIVDTMSRTPSEVANVIWRTASRPADG